MLMINEDKKEINFEEWIKLEIKKKKNKKIEDKIGTDEMMVFNDKTMYYLDQNYN